MNVNTLDYNDMRDMITEIEQKLITVDPLRQMRFYEVLQGKIYDAYTFAMDDSNILLYPETDPLPINLN